MSGDVVPGFTPVAIDANIAASPAPPVNRAMLSTLSMRELAEAMTDPPDPGSVNRRWGIIAAYHGAPSYTVDVTIGGVLIPGLAYDAAYTPTVNEVVMLDVVGSDTVVIGTTAPGLWRTGQIEPTFLATPKAGALFCQGQTLSRTTYANLWSWITANGLSAGKPFGSGDGSTTFTLPDLRGRMPVGAGTLGTDTYAIGDTPGAARVTLATNQMPAHQHSPTATTTLGAHTHTFSGTLSVTSGSGTASGTTGAESGHTHGIPITFNNGAVGAHNHGGGAPGNTSESANPSSGTTSAGTFGSSGHTHSFNDGGHTHSVSGTVSGTTGSTTATATTTVSESTIGGSTPVDIRQPAFVVNWLIYV